jgi:flagellar biogenesis protein FliO
MKREEQHAIAIAKAKERKRTHRFNHRERTEDNMATMARDHIGLVAAMAIIFGTWGLATLISAMLASGGPVALLKNWFKAVTGLW